MNLLKRLIPHKHKFKPIIYGLLSAKGMMEVEQGRYIAGGCCVPDDNVHFACIICGKEIIVCPSCFKNMVLVFEDKDAIQELNEKESKDGN